MPRQQQSEQVTLKDRSGSAPELALMPEEETAASEICLCLVCWCGARVINSLDFNVTKYKGNINWFDETFNSSFQTSLAGVKSHTYSAHRRTVSDKMVFNQNTSSYQKCQPRVFCLQTLRSLIINLCLYANYTGAVLNPSITFSFLCWFGGLSVRGKTVLNKAVNGKGESENQDQ